MGELFCNKDVVLEDYVDVSNYYVYDGLMGRISSKYIENEDGEIEETPEGGRFRGRFNLADCYSIELWVVQRKQLHLKVTC